MGLGTSGPLVEEFYLGEPNLEAFYTTWPLSAMAVQPDLPPETKRARCVEAHGYHRKPPVSGERQCYVSERPDRLDEISIAATRRGLKDCADEEEAREIVSAYVESQTPDVWWISYRARKHPNLVIAVLDDLYERGELPPRFDWGA